MVIPVPYLMSTGVGKKSLKEVKEKLIELGLGFKPID